MAVHHGNHPERFFIGRVGDKIIVDANKTKRAVGKIRAAVAALRERNEFPEGNIDLGYQHGERCRDLPELCEPRFHRYR